jgi:hypothetical protein
MQSGFMQVRIGVWTAGLPAILCCLATIEPIMLVRQFSAACFVIGTIYGILRSRASRGALADQVLAFGQFNAQGSAISRLKKRCFILDRSNAKIPNALAYAVNPWFFACNARQDTAIGACKHNTVQLNLGRARLLKRYGRFAKQQA